jgi:FtsH-binding integral membrane protein
MTYYDSRGRPVHHRTVGSAGSAAAIDAGLRNYMIRIYTYMAGGLAVTAIAAYVAASSGSISRS